MGEPSLFIYRDVDDPLPTDPDTIILARQGAYRMTANPFFRRYERVEEVSMLAEQTIEAYYLLPPLPAHLTLKILNFFREVYRRHHSEAILLLAYNQESGEFLLVAPKQTVTAGHCKYEPRTAVPEGYMLVGTIHSHGSFGACHSGTDVHDEETFDGVHVTYGDVDSDLFSISATLAVSAYRYSLKPEQVLGGLRFEKHEPFTPIDTMSHSKIKIGVWDSIWRMMFGVGIVPVERADSPAKVLTTASSGYAVDVTEEEKAAAEPDPAWYVQVTDGARPIKIANTGVVSTFGYPMTAGFMGAEPLGGEEDLEDYLPGAYTSPKRRRSFPRFEESEAIDLDLRERRPGNAPPRFVRASCTGDVTGHLERVHRTASATCNRITPAGLTQAPKLVKETEEPSTGQAQTEHDFATQKDSDEKGDR